MATIHSGASPRLGAGVLEPRLLFAVALSLALVLAWLPVEWTIGRFIYDDMFYYLRVAQHIVAGQGSTFDGIASTNGYHPLWMIICVALALVLSGDMLVHGVLTVAALLHVAQGIVLWRILAEHVRPAVALFLTALYLLNWRTLAINLCGLEAPLATFLALAIFQQFLQSDVSSNVRSSFKAGLLLGLGALARFDLLLLVGFGCIWIFLASRQDLRRSLIDRLHCTAAAGVGVFIVLLPWFVFSHRISDALLPNSRHAVKYLSGISYDPSSPLQVLEQLRKQTMSFLYWSSDIANMLGLVPFAAPYGKGRYVALLLVMLAVLVVVGGLLAFRREKVARIGLVVLLYVGIHAGYYAVFHRVELRYIMPALALFFLATGLMVEVVLRRFPSPQLRWAMSTGAVTAFVFATISGLSAADRGHGSVRAHKYHYVALDMARWLAKHHPNAVIGAWNAGILSYFSQTQLVNLDGVINDHALKAVARSRIGDYILERRVGIIVDEPVTIEENLARFDKARSCCALVGPILYAATDGQGRYIVARPVVVE